MPIDDVSPQTDRETAATPRILDPGEPIAADGSAKTVGQEELVNIINRCHFLETTILIQIKHPRYGDHIILESSVEACRGKDFTLRLKHAADTSSLAGELGVVHLIVDSGNAAVIIPAVLKNLESDVLQVSLPEQGMAVSRRRARRYSCRKVSVEMIQNDLAARGTLIDFTPLGFRVRTPPEFHEQVSGFNTETSLIVLVRDDRHRLFSAPCTVIRIERKGKVHEIVLVPEQDTIRRFGVRKTRNPRRNLSPSPTIVFDHPLVRKRVHREVSDISSSGFSVHEKPDEVLLMPGLIIPQLTINYVDAVKLTCSAQVIYRQPAEDDMIRCGLAITDMSIESYSFLTGILARAQDPHAYVSPEVDMDELWEFLFESGFIYPSKYRLMQTDRDLFKETYRVLYQENPDIAKHFTYQKNGRIYGHISMVKAYEKSWLVQHFAAEGVEGRRVGFVVLKQIIAYLNDAYRLPSSGTDYALCFYRPDKRIPNMLFGGFARMLDDPQGCSTDLFCYLPYTGYSINLELPRGWRLEESTPYDVAELNRFYRTVSGGILMKALGFDGEDYYSSSVEEAYGRIGFLRKVKVFSLFHEQKLAAVFLVDRSQRGLNLSELLNSIKVFVVDPENLHWDVLSVAISRLTNEFRMNQIPVLFYPREYVEAEDIPYERLYSFWTLNMKSLHRYIDFIQNKLRISYK